MKREGVRSVEWGSAIFRWGRGSAPCFLQFQILRHFFRNYFFYSFVLLLTKKRKTMLKKLLNRLEDNPHQIEPILYCGSFLLAIIITIIDFTYFN